MSQVLEFNLDPLLAEIVTVFVIIVIPYSNKIVLK